MSEEEKEAIETLKEVASDDFDTLGDDISPKMAQNILNVIEKQQKLIKENEELKKEIEEKTTIIMAGAEKVKQLEKEIQRLEKDNDTLSELVIVNEDKVIKELDLISKDKIREKIKKLKKRKDISQVVGSIVILEELLEDNKNENKM